MRHNIISYSFVAVWKKPIAQIPILDNKFCLDLFGDPYNTNATLTPEGFVIKLSMAKIPNPAVIINSKRIAIISYDLNQVKETVSKVSNELKKFANISLSIGAVGINTEHEFVEMEEQSSILLAKKFVLPGIKSTSGKKKPIVNVTDLKFQIIAEENEKYNIQVQPRANLLDGLFFSINNHLQIEYDSIPEPTEVNRLFAETLKNLEDRVFPLLF